jgi:tetratricopeptide (TPR) repeat protein
MKRNCFCIILLAWLFAGFTASAARGETVTALSVSWDDSGALPGEGFTEGGFLWMAEHDADNVLFAYTAHEPLTDVAFCTLDFDVNEEGEETFSAGRLLWKLPDMAPGDTVRVYCATMDWDGDAAPVTLRYTGADGVTAGAGAQPYEDEDDLYGEMRFRLLRVLVTEAAEPADRDAAEAQAQAYGRHYAEEGDEAWLDLLFELYEDILEKAPYTGWAYRGSAAALAADLDEYSPHWQAVLRSLNAAVSLGEDDAETRYLRALAQSNFAWNRYGYQDPGDEGWPLYIGAIRDIEQAIALAPEDFPYDCDTLYVMLLNAVSWYDQAAVLEAEIRIKQSCEALRRDPGDTEAYALLMLSLNERGYLDEAAEALAAWLAYRQPGAPEPLSTAADAAYEAGHYEEAIRLYREAVAQNEEEDESDLRLCFPMRAWYRLTDAYCQLARYDEAAQVLGNIEDWYPYEVPPIFFNQTAEILMAAGRPDAAKAVLFESFELWHNLEGRELLAKINRMLPAGAGKVFEGTAWEDYEPVATAVYRWRLLSAVATVLRKDGHDVLCLMEGSGDPETYRLVAANDRAVRQDGAVPSLYIDDAMGSLTVEYTYPDAPQGAYAAEGYIFCTRWFWEEMEEYEAEGDWEYRLLMAYRLYPEPHAPGAKYVDSDGICLSFSPDSLMLESFEASYDGSWGGWDLLAETDADNAAFAYDLARFDIALCDHDFITLMKEGAS